MATFQIDDSFGLRGRVALVTGGSRGIGRATTLKLAQTGVHVAINYSQDQDSAEKTADEARQFGVEALAMRQNVAKVESPEALVRETLERFKQLDILVCNAGLWKGSPVELMSESLWDEVMDTNLKGTWAMCRAVAPAMKSQMFGRVVIVSSTAGQRGEDGYSNYAASKGGQIAFMKSIAVELAPFGITVNCVAPGWVDTEMTADVLHDSTSRSEIERSIPVGRVATPEDIAYPIVFLCSDWARHITGSVLSVNGGSVLCG